MPKRPSPRKRKPRRRVPVMRWIALGTVVFVGLLYYRPLKSYVETRQSLEQRAEEVRSLRAERDDLARRLAESDTPESLARRARRLGLVKPGERLFIVKGVEEWRRRGGAAATTPRIGGDG